MRKIRNIVAMASERTTYKTPPFARHLFGAAALVIGLAAVPASAESLALIGYGTGFAATQAAAYSIAYNIADSYIQAGCSQGAVTGEVLVNFNYYWNGSNWVANVQLAATCASQSDAIRLRR